MITATYFDLWDTDTGNSLGTYRTQEEALAVVVVLLDTHGDSYADDLDLGEIDDEHFRLIATGATLATMARVAATRPALTRIRTASG